MRFVPSSIDMGVRQLWSRKPATPLIMQTSEADCGLACLAMTACANGVPTTLRELKNRVGGSRGLTLKSLVDISTILDLTTRPLRCEMDGLTTIKLPAILHWDFNHFVVLVALKGRRTAIIYDPAQGKRELPLREISKHWTGAVLEVNARSETFNTDSSRTNKDRFLFLREWTKIRGLRLAATQILGVSFALEITQLSGPLLLQVITDQVILSGDRNLIVVVGFAFIIFLLGQLTFDAMRKLLLIYVANQLNTQLLIRLFAHLLKLPPAFVQDRHLGDITSRFQSLAVVQRTLTTSFTTAILDGLMSIVAIVAICAYSKGLGLITILSGIVYTLVRVLFFRTLSNATTEQLIAGARENASFLETVRGFPTIKLFTAEEARLAVWKNSVVQRVNAESQSQNLDLIFSTARIGIFGASAACTVCLGAYGVLNGELTVGMMLAAAAFNLQFSARASGLIDKASDFAVLSAHSDRIAEIVMESPESDAVSTNSQIPSTSDLQVRDVTFSYPGEPNLFGPISFTTSKGEVFGIVGPSGSGKTTLLKILAGLLSPTSGVISFAGRSVQSIPPRIYRRALGVVLQNDTLFAGTILENITFFELEPNEEQAKDAASLANIHDDIQAMPLKYDTRISEMGAGLSGGQVQRIVFARALYKKPELLLLDEATSHLDVASDAAVSKTLRSLGITSIVVAHRPETIAKCDRILDISNGKISIVDK